MTKVCRVCGRRLPLRDLVKDRGAGLGRASICKACYRDVRKSYPSYNRRKEAT
ncbi:MAG: hypothetical protein IKN60_04615 [Bacteroidales bacterium]|nr:hypothetical protein [Bacteroidales bacterium]